MQGRPQKGVPTLRQTDHDLGEGDQHLIGPLIWLRAGASILALADVTSGYVVAAEPSATQQVPRW